MQSTTTSFPTSTYPVYTDFIQLNTKFPLRPPTLRPSYPTQSNRGATILQAIKNAITPLFTLTNLREKNPPRIPRNFT
jgi:hypothetical protein